MEKSIAQVNESTTTSVNFSNDQASSIHNMKNIMNALSETIQEQKLKVESVSEIIKTLSVREMKEHKKAFQLKCKF